MIEIIKQFLLKGRRNTARIKDISASISRLQSKVAAIEKTLEDHSAAISHLAMIQAEVLAEFSTILESSQGKSGISDPYASLLSPSDEDFINQGGSHGWIPPGRYSGI